MHRLIPPECCTGPASLLLVWSFYSVALSCYCGYVDQQETRSNPYHCHCRQWDKNLRVRSICVRETLRNTLFSWDHARRCQHSHQCVSHIRPTSCTINSSSRRLPWRRWSVWTVCIFVGAFVSLVALVLMLYAFVFACFC